jgi:hypothetical protein
MSLKRLGAVFGLGLAGAQAGHLLAYQVQFGSAAQRMESTGGHQYFPVLVKSSLGALALSLLAVLFFIAISRTLGPRRPVPVHRPQPYIALLAGLFTLQFAIFSVQEVVEAAVSGSATASVTYLLLWGSFGQLPVAAAGSLTWRWLSTRFEAAIDEMRENLELVSLPPLPAILTIWTPLPQALLISRTAGRALVKRGPPASLRLSSI